MILRVVNQQSGLGMVCYAVEETLQVAWLRRKESGCCRSVEEVLIKVSKTGATHTGSTKQQQANWKAVQ